MAVGPGNDSCGGCCCDEDKNDDKKKSGGMVVKVGQKVLYKKWGGNEVKVENQEWLLLEQKDVMAVVE